GLIRPLRMFLIGFGILTVQILLIPVFATDHVGALHLISYTGLPIILINSIGIWICAMIFFSVAQSVERTRANQTAEAFSIVEETLSLFRQGLNDTSATKAAQIIQKLTHVDQVAITRGVRQLAHTGDTAFEENSIQSELKYREQVLQTGKTVITKSFSNIHPLFSGRKTVNTTF